MGIEPTYLAWKASVLPLNYTRTGGMPRTGIEPVTRGFSVLCSTNGAIWASINNAGDRNRTGTVLPQQDFKSCASACSATPALNGWRWIRTTEAICSRFTVCPLWPLGNPSISQNNNNSDRNKLYHTYFKNASTFFKFFILFSQKRSFLNQQKPENSLGAG